MVVMLGWWRLPAGCASRNTRARMLASGTSQVSVVAKPRLLLGLDLQRCLFHRRARTDLDGVFARRKIALARGSQRIGEEIIELRVERPGRACGGRGMLFLRFG